MEAPAQTSSQDKAQQEPQQSFTEAPQQAAAVPIKDEKTGGKEIITFYKCNFCGKPLFSERRLEKHQIKPKYRFKDDRKIGGKTKREHCTSYFLEDIMPWMPTPKDSIGKILCPNCKHKLGSYTLFGDTCSCGTFVEPAIRIHKKCVSSFEAAI